MKVEAPPQVEHLRRALTPAGLDLVAPFHAAAYNRAAPSMPLPTPAGPRTLALLVGNSRALWAPFLAWYAADARRADPDPIDRYVAEALAAAVLPFGPGVDVRRDPEPAPRRVALQIAAEVAGLAWRSPAGLSIHPVLGPWFALRAAVVLPVAVDVPAPPPPPPCGACAGGCLPPFRQAMDGLRDPDVAAGVRVAWRDWVAVRDACPIGRSHRYDPLQIRYHYTHDRGILDQVIRAP